MNLEQMEYIKEIIHTKSISIAAQNLQVSQSAVSQSISLLEKELGIRLFKRSRSGTTPTEEGKNIINIALKIVENIEKIKEEASMNSSFKGELKIASIQSLMTILPKILSQFKNDFPQIKVTVLEMESKKIIENVKNHTIDLGFITIKKSIINTLPEQHVILKILDYHADIKVIVPKESPLAFQQSITVQELSDYPIVLYTSQFWQNFIESYQEAHGELNVLFYTSNTEVIKKTVAEGLAMGFVSNFSLNDDPYVESGRIIPLTLNDFNFVSELYYGCITSKKNAHFNMSKKFLEYVNSK